MLRGELQLFAPCPRGLEAALADELTALGASACRITGGGVAFAGDAVLAMAANLHSRIASRILMQVAWGAAETKIRSTSSFAASNGSVGSTSA